MPAKPPNPVDVHVGGRVRMRRIEIDMSQEILGQHLGLSFQQIQKYEKGMNRIGASRLQQIATLLGVPVGYFFEGAPGGHDEGEREQTMTGSFLEFLGTRDGQSLIESFSKISDAKLRRSIIDLVERMASMHTPPTTPTRARPKR
jgi:transcriptional regulator with XRE-family HTH domain